MPSSNFQAAVSSVESNADAAPDQIPAPNEKKYAEKLTLDVLAEVALSLDRFSLDRAGFAWPKFRAAVVEMPPGECLRKLESVHLTVTGTPNDRRKGGDRAPFSITTHGWEDPMTLRNGATQTDCSQSWGFDDIASTTSHFMGLLRFASVRELSTDGPVPLQFFQALAEVSTPTTDVGSLELRQSALQAGHLPAVRGALTTFRRLGVLDLQGRDVPLDFLTDEFLVAMAARRTTHVRVAAPIKVPLDWSGGWDDHRHSNYHVHSVHEKLTCVDDCPHLSTGLTAFMFRDYEYPFDDGVAHAAGLNIAPSSDTSNVELFFAAARVPSGISQSIMEAAVSSKSDYYIYASFVALTDVDIHLEGFEARERHDGCVWYKVPSLHDANVVNELFVTAVELPVPGQHDFNVLDDDRRGPRNGWTCIVFRRYRESASS